MRQRAPPANMPDMSGPLAPAAFSPPAVPKGTALTCRSWLTEAPYRMLLNNLDPEVAERRAEGVAKNVTETVGTAVEKGLHSLNVPTRKELRSLSAKVDGLGKKIDALKTRKAPRATRTAR